MRILVSNDDGIEAIGLRALVKELKKIGDVTVVAPNTQRSASSHCLTIKGSLKVKETPIDDDITGWAVYGTPADCVHLAVKKILAVKPDLIVSGINQGFNISSDCIYSGTVAAAREGFILGIPSIAVSLDSFTSADFSYAAEVARLVSLDFLNDKHNLEYMLNVNVPAVDRELIKGYKVCEFAGVRDYDENFIHTQDEEFHYYHVGDLDVSTFLKGNELRYDVVALKENYVTVTPLDIDLVNHQYLTPLAAHWEK
ncbi:MAG: 5'/3'-nucleotidase SurE [Erysipelotrichaceae bacterium]|nr:5'/3'-nucleotidase SurE [Erysipelotrichaceae bacterium]